MHEYTCLQLCVSNLSSFKLLNHDWNATCNHCVIDYVWTCCIIHVSLTIGDVPLLILRPTIIDTDISITFQNLCILTNDISSY